MPCAINFDRVSLGQRDRIGAVLCSLCPRSVGLRSAKRCYVPVVSTTSLSTMPPAGSSGSSPIVFGRAVTKAHSHAAQAHCRDFQIALPKFPFLHNLSFAPFLTLRNLCQCNVGPVAGNPRQSVKAHARAVRLCNVKRGVLRRSGAWVFRDTRMPVATVFENLEFGSSIEEIIEQYDVTPEQIQAMLEFAARSLDAPPLPTRRGCYV